MKSQELGGQARGEGREGGSRQAWAPTDSLKMSTGSLDRTIDRLGNVRTAERAAARPPGGDAPLDHWIGISTVGQPVEKTLTGAAIATGSLSAVDVGFGPGLSVLALLRGLLVNAVARGERRERARVFTMDPYQRTHWKEAGLLALREAGVADLVDFAEAESHARLAELLAQAPWGVAQPGVVFIDGQHHFDHVLLEVFFAHRIIPTGGLIVIDDVWMPGVRQAMAWWLAHRNCELVRLVEGAGSAWRVETIETGLAEQGAIGLSDRLLALAEPRKAGVLRKTGNELGAWDLHVAWS